MVIMIGSFDGIRVTESTACIEKVWNFPASKHRSARQHKKLLKRFGVQYYERPAAYMVSGALVAHPEIIKQMAQDNRIVKLENFS